MSMRDGKGFAVEYYVQLSRVEIGGVGTLRLEGNVGRRVISENNVFAMKSATECDVAMVGFQRLSTAQNNCRKLTRKHPEAKVVCFNWPLIRSKNGVITQADLVPPVEAVKPVKPPPLKPIGVPIPTVSMPARLATTRDALGNQPTAYALIGVAAGTQVILESMAHQPKLYLRQVGNRLTVQWRALLDKREGDILISLARACGIEVFSMNNPLAENEMMVDWSVTTTATSDEIDYMTKTYRLTTWKNPI